MKFRKIDPDRDKSAVLELHCEINYACDTSWARELPYPDYREKWMSTSQPEPFFSRVIETMADPRTMAELAETEDGRLAGYLWVTFADVPDYGLVIAEINDFLIVPEFRRQGLGVLLLSHIEQEARRRGANLLRSETGAENTASRQLHDKAGFETYRVCYEKRL